MKNKDVIKAITTLLIFISLFALYVICGSLEYGSLTERQAVVQGVIWMVVAFVSLSVYLALGEEKEIEQE